MGRVRVYSTGCSNFSSSSSAQTIAGIPNEPEFPELEDEKFEHPVEYTLTLHEVKEKLIRDLQQEHFPAEIAKLKSGNLVPRKSVLYKNHPQIDERGILKVVGRFTPDLAQTR